MECPPDLRSYLSAVQFTALYTFLDIAHQSLRNERITIQRHPGPDGRLPSRHVACPMSLGYFRSASPSRRSAVVGLSPTSISASGLRTARYYQRGVTYKAGKDCSESCAASAMSQCTVRCLERRLRTARDEVWPPSDKSRMQQSASLNLASHLN